jgi:hypothetical protein
MRASLATVHRLNLTIRIVHLFDCQTRIPSSPSGIIKPALKAKGQLRVLEAGARSRFPEAVSPVTKGREAVQWSS